MATRSTICLVLKKEDIGKTMKFDLAKLPKDYAYELCKEVRKFHEVELTKPILEIYHHWDGYPEGVGLTLLTYFNDYDTILNLLLGGDASSINDGVCQYYAWRKEDWDRVKPKGVDTAVCSEDYVYKFEDGVWTFKGYDDKDWIDLKTYLAENE